MASFSRYVLKLLQYLRYIELIAFCRDYVKIIGMDADLRKIGIRIREIRTGLEINQVAFGEKIGVKGATVSKYENGESDAGALTFNEIAKLGKRSLDWLITGAAPEKIAYSTAVIGNENFNEAGHVDLTLVKQIVAAVVEHLQTEQLSLTPEAHAEVVEVLYEEISESIDKQVNKGTVARMIKLAS